MIEVKHIHFDRAFPISRVYYLVNNKLLSFDVRIYASGEIKISNFVYSIFDYIYNADMTLTPYYIDSFYITEHELELITEISNFDSIARKELVSKYGKIITEISVFLNKNNEITIDTEPNEKDSEASSNYSYVDYNAWLVNPNKTSFEKLMYPLLYGLITGYRIDHDIKLKRKYKLNALFKYE